MFKSCNFETTNKIYDQKTSQKFPVNLILKRPILNKFKYLIISTSEHYDTHISKQMVELLLVLVSTSSNLLLLLTDKVPLIIHNNSIIIIQ